MPRLFFFYGTLIAGSNNPAAHAVHGQLRPIGVASVPGALWAIPDIAGWYPALMPGPGGPVHGVLYEAVEGFGVDELARLDEWEDFRADRPMESLYLREQMPVTDAAGATRPAQVYRFNQPLPADARLILKGDFQAWLKATGYPAYAG